MTKTVHGVIRGRTIQLSEDVGVAEGEEVEVQVRTLPRPSGMLGEGFVRTEGALADDTGWDATMDELYRSRKLDRSSQAGDIGEE